MCAGEGQAAPSRGAGGGNSCCPSRFASAQQQQQSGWGGGGRVEVGGWTGGGSRAGRGGLSPQPPLPSLPHLTSGNSLSAVKTVTRRLHTASTAFVTALRLVSHASPSMLRMERVLGGGCVRVCVGGRGCCRGGARPPGQSRRERGSGSRWRGGGGGQHERRAGHTVGGPVAEVQVEAAWEQGGGGGCCVPRPGLQMDWLAACAWVAQGPTHVWVGDDVRSRSTGITHAWALHTGGPGGCPPPHLPPNPGSLRPGWPCLPAPRPPPHPPKPDPLTARQPRGGPSQRCGRPRSGTRCSAP